MFRASEEWRPLFNLRARSDYIKLRVLGRGAHFRSLGLDSGALSTMEAAHRFEQQGLWGL